MEVYEGLGLVFKVRGRAAPYMEYSSHCLFGFVYHGGR